LETRSSPYRDPEKVETDETTVGFITTVAYGVPRGTKTQAVADFYKHRLRGWRLVEDFGRPTQAVSAPRTGQRPPTRQGKRSALAAAPIPVFSFDRGDAYVSVNLDNVPYGKFEVVVDFDHYGKNKYNRIGGLSGANSSASVACHVTKPNGSTAPGERPSDTFHGKRGLWTVLPPDGRLVISNTHPPPPGTTFGKVYRDGSLSTKFGWWGSRAAAAKLRIGGRRLDAQARRLRLTVGRGATARAPHFWPSRLRFASPGCWRVIGRSGRARLTFTIAVRSAAH
jgi:hypothetical protein